MKTLADFFKPLRKTNPVLKNVNTPPTPATPSTPLTPRTPLQTPQTPHTPPTPRSPDTTTSTTTKTTTAVKRKRKCSRNQQQLYLDFGQASFGSRTICPICNTLVVNGLQEDEREHERICSEYRLGVAFQMWKNARIFSKSGSVIPKVGIGSMCIVEIRPGDHIQLRRKALQVKKIVDQELGFSVVKKSKSTDAERVNVDTAAEDDDSSSASLGGKTVFLFIQDKRVVGFCSVEVIPRAYLLLVQENDDAKSVMNDEALPSKGNDVKRKEAEQLHVSNLETDRDTIPARIRQTTYARSKEPTKAIMGVHQLWCHKDHRHKSIASRLVDAARSKLVYGMVVPHRLVAFSSPTADGAVFARRYTHPCLPLVYECR